MFIKGYTAILLGILFMSKSLAQDTTSISGGELPLVPFTVSLQGQVHTTDITHASPRYILNIEKLARLGVVDVGSALKFVPGIQVKDYGGIGGIKTISFRSLGATHSNLLLDNAIQINTQTGAMNLSSFELFGVQQVVFSAGMPKSVSSNASAYLSANSISVKSIIGNPTKKISLKLYQNITSVNAYESGVLFSIPLFKKHGFFGIQSMAKYGTGQYDYKYVLSGTDETFRRTNADLINYKIRTVIGYKWDKALVKLNFKYNNNDQKLPGAVILFNPSNDQEMQNEDIGADLQFSASNEKWILKLNSFAQSNYSRYFDPYFLNFQGFIESNYTQLNSGGGFMVNRKFTDETQRFFVGTDVFSSQLSSNEFSAKPKRNQLNSVLGITKWLWRIKVESNLTHQLIADNARYGDSIVNQQFSRFSPFISFSYVPFKKHRFRIRAFYKNGFRMPTFNDLYYNFIGNTNLKPEEVQQFNFGLTYAKKINKNRLEMNVDSYYNYVENKIVAIPTKDLFNWSMQNIGKTNIYGVDFAISYSMNIRNWGLLLSTNHSLNQSLDVTDANSSSYKNQIPYTPIYSSSASLSVLWKGSTFTTNMMYTGPRYSLNENIQANYLESFFDWNVGLKQKFDFDNSTSFSASVKVMNLLGNNYEVIRSFPMPGRYVQLTLKYNLE
jgi:outer membrane cobalamin receptor